jgi:hypothetical protein
MQLHRTDDLVAIASHEEDCGWRCVNGLSPPIRRALERERREKTHGSSGLDCIDQELSDRAEIGVAYRQRQALDRALLFGHD